MRLLYEPGNRETANGFTLIETLVVLTLLALSLTIVVPTTMAALAGLRLRVAANDLAIELRALRSRAEMVGSVQVLTLDPSQLTYNVGRDVAPRTLAGMVDRIVVDPPERKGLDHLVRIGFFPGRGATPAMVTLMSGSRTEIIRVDRLTGLVSRDQ